MSNDKSSRKSCRRRLFPGAFLATSPTNFLTNNTSKTFISYITITDSLELIYFLNQLYGPIKYPKGLFLTSSTFRIFLVMVHSTFSTEIFQGDKRCRVIKSKEYFKYKQIVLREVVAVIATQRKNTLKLSSLTMFAKSHNGISKIFPA